MVEDKNSEELWKELLGEQEMPEFNIRDEMRDGEGFQSTLGSFQSWARFLDKSEQVNGILEEVYGEGNGLNSAILYGSDVSGLVLLPSAPYINGNKGSGDGSDMDVMLLVEEGPLEDARKNLAQILMTERNGNRPFKDYERFPS